MFSKSPVGVTNKDSLWSRECWPLVVFDFCSIEVGLFYCFNLLLFWFIIDWCWQHWSNCHVLHLAAALIILEWIPLSVPASFFTSYFVSLLLENAYVFMQWFLALTRNLFIAGFSAMFICRLVNVFCIWAGTPCFRGYGRRNGERRRKSVRGCIVSPDLSVLNLVIVKKGESDLPGLTDVEKPRMRGPKRASKIRKLFNLSKEDDVRKYVNTYRRTFTTKAGKFPEVHKFSICVCMLGR